MATSAHHALGGLVQVAAVSRHGARQDAAPAPAPLEVLHQHEAAAAAAAADGASATADAAAPPQPPPPSLLGRLRHFCVDNFMVLSFSLALLIAMAAPAPGRAVGALQVGDVKAVQALNNILVFLVSGLTLRSDDVKALMHAWPAWLYGIVAILGVTPCAGFGMARLPLRPPDFAVGLAIFAVVPTTLGVGVALTAASRGNQALALLLTVVTNLLGIVTVPYTLRLVLANTPGTVTVDPRSLVPKLLVTVLVPTVAGKLLQQLVPAVRAFAARRRTALSMFSTANLAMIVWQTLSGAQHILVRLPLADVALVVAAASALHVAFLAANGAAVWALRLPRREAVAALIMASQKSAPVAVTVISYLTPDAAKQGLMALPCIVGQLGQIFIGAVLARWLRTLKTPEEED